MVTHIGVGVGWTHPRVECVTKNSKFIYMCKRSNKQIGLFGFTFHPEMIPPYNQLSLQLTCKAVLGYVRLAATCCIALTGLAFIGLVYHLYKIKWFSGFSHILVEISQKLKKKSCALGIKIGYQSYIKSTKLAIT